MLDISWDEVKPAAETEMAGVAVTPNVLRLGMNQGQGQGPCKSVFFFRTLVWDSGIGIAATRRWLVGYLNVLTYTCIWMDWTDHKTTRSMRMPEATVRATEYRRIRSQLIITERLSCRN